MNKALSACQEETYGKLKQTAHAYGVSFIIRSQRVACAVWHVQIFTLLGIGMVCLTERQGLCLRNTYSFGKQTS